MQWAKITTATSTSSSIARLRAEGSVGRDACCIFLMSLAHGGSYGILPGEPERFGALVCPLFRLTPKAIEQRLNLLCKHDFYHQYEVNSHALIWITNYHRFQDTRWYRIGRPDYALPDCWTVPDDLAEHLKATKDEPKAHKYGHYGLRDSHLKQVGLYDELTGNARQEQTMPGNGCEDVCTALLCTEEDVRRTSYPAGEPNSANAPHQKLVDDCLAGLGGLAEEGGARVTVENTIGSHPLAAEVILAECVALAARADQKDGRPVHLSYLPRNVAEAARREAKARERGETALQGRRPKYTPPAPSSDFDAEGVANLEDELRRTGHRIAGDTQEQEEQ